MKIVVTGGASGLGEALVNRLASQEVWILDVKPSESLHEGHQFVALDLADPEQIDSVLTDLPSSIDGLANVAGIATAAQPEKVLAVNFLGLRHLSHALAPRLVEGGAIVNVSSTAGRDWHAKYERLKPLLETGSFAEGLAWCRENEALYARDPYTFSKRLVTAHTLRAAQLGVQQKFRVNCVSPGPIETPLYPQFESLMGKTQSDWMKAQTGRIADAQDIAEVVDLLLTGQCGWLNGVDIPVDGGYTAGMESGWVDFSQSPIMRDRSSG
jgi:NAD(P)-dependent dehydrogenase (short-subunit alcohol dehydrogenase family)